jgi:uncharacterized protein with PIN domain
MTGLDRVRPRTAKASPSASATEIRDADGKRALFSVAESEPAPAFGSVTIECGSCHERSVLSPMQGLRAVVPSIHLPVVRREHPSWLRCPACGRFSWVRVSIQL